VVTRQLQVERRTGKVRRQRPTFYGLNCSEEKSFRTNNVRQTFECGPARGAGLRTCRAVARIASRGRSEPCRNFLGRSSSSRDSAIRDRTPSSVRAVCIHDSRELALRSEVSSFLQPENVAACFSMHQVTQVHVRTAKFSAAPVHSLFASSKLK